MHREHSADISAVVLIWLLRIQPNMQDMCPSDASDINDREDFEVNKNGTVFFDNTHATSRALSLSGR